MLPKHKSEAAPHWLKQRADAMFDSGMHVNVGMNATWSNTFAWTCLHTSYDAHLVHASFRPCRLYSESSQPSECASTLQWPVFGTSYHLSSAISSKYEVRHGKQLAPQSGINFFFNELFKVRDTRTIWGRIPMSQYRLCSCHGFKYEVVVFFPVPLSTSELSMPLIKIVNQVGHVRCLANTS